MQQAAIRLGQISANTEIAELLSCPFCVCYGIGLSINLLYVLFLLIDDPLGMIGGEIF